MIRKSKDMVETVGYADTKMIIGDEIVVIFNHYKNKLADLNGLANEVIHGKITKATALTTIDELITSNAFTSLQNYFAKEPGENAYNGALFLLGDNFNDQLNDASILATIEEASNRDI